MRDDTSESEISWPESEHNQIVLPITPAAERTHDIFGTKRKRDHDASVSEHDSRDEPQTPVKEQKIKQLQTPPNTDRRRKLGHANGVDQSPSKLAAQKRTAELVSEVDSNESLGSFGTKLRLHIHRQDRLLDASDRSRNVLRNLVYTRDAEILALRERLKVYENERETNRALSLALKREIQFLKARHQTPSS